MNKVRAILRKIRFCIVHPLYQKLLVIRLRHKKEINVVFIATSIPMWRYQNIYELMNKYSRFRTSVVIIPTVVYSKDQQTADVLSLKKYFDSLGIRYYVGSEDATFDMRGILKPDILFYPQPYLGVFSYQYEYFNYRDRLLCYYPYAFWMSTGDWSYNELLHNYAWKLFYSTELHRMDAKKYAENKGRNVSVVGYPNADNFLTNSHKNVWKPQTKCKKKVIWAPHFTIFSGGALQQSNFLWMAEFMLKLTERYSDNVQFIFKPHPRLITELYKHHDWGKQKAVYYYNEWATRENTQLETGEFVDLFMTSDAMIHDSGSFCVEYHYSKNPVMYIADNFEQQVAEKGEFGKMAMRQH